MKNIIKVNQERQLRRQRRVRAKIRGTKERPRLAVFRSHQHIYAQLIDDDRAVTLLSFCDRELTGKETDLPGGKKEKKAYAVGLGLAVKAEKQKIKRVVFDRGRYKYHGRVKALAEGARKGGLNF
ncbi:MAG: 50S ribosomal protein L18 [Patescibacteria group bacterium]